MKPVLRNMISGKWDRGLWVSSGLLCAISLMALASASATLHQGLVARQAMWIALGIMVAVAVGSKAYTWWIDASPVFYLGILVVLGVVMTAGTVKLGAARWITLCGLSIQPSELAKLITASTLARYLASSSSSVSGRSLVVSAILAAGPALLIFLQPDLGTSSVLVVMWFVTLWAAGLSRARLAGLGVLVLGALPVGWHFLRDYQRTRLLVFLNPQIDPLGAGYTIIQSEIAIGSGQLVGRGWLAGTQNQLSFLPERHADFLFSVIGEEWGFVGGVVVVGLLSCLVWRGVMIALRNSEPRGRLLAVALTAWIAYQAIVNIGMVMGVLPTVGVPLPLVSYGGSAVVTTLMAVGLLQSIHRFGTRF